MSYRLLILLAVVKVINTWQMEQGPNAKGVPEIKTKACTPNDFATNGTCTLGCTVSTLATNTKLVQHKFIYFSADPNIYIEFFDAKYIDDDVRRSYTGSLTLSDYNAGYYQCQYVFRTKDDSAVFYPMATFKIANSAGMPLNSACNYGSECVTLNSRCDSSLTKSGKKTCNCNGHYNISFNSRTDSPACLPPLTITDKCYADAQCHEFKKNYICKDNTCMCPYATAAKPEACKEANSMVKSRAQAFFDKLSGQQIMILTLVGSAIALPALVIVLWSLFHYEGYISIPTPCGVCLAGQHRQNQRGGSKLCPCCSFIEGNLNPMDMANGLANGELDPLNVNPNDGSNPMANITNPPGSVVSGQPNTLNNVTNSMNSVVSGVSIPNNIPHVTNGETSSNGEQI